MDRSDPNGGGRVPEEELAEIRRQLRSVLAPPMAPPDTTKRNPVRSSGQHETSAGLMRLAVRYTLPGAALIVAILVMQQL